MNKLNYLSYLCLIVFCISTITHANPIIKDATVEDVTYNQIQRVRIDFTMPNGYVRHLLLAFTPDNAASDGVDYGYDALNADNFPDDLNWMIENQRYVIQGVGEFNDTKQYPLGMFITNAGDISIALDTLENFDTAINVYLFDALNNSYTLLNEVDFQETVASGTHLDRYYIAFRNNTNGNIINGASEMLSISDNIKEETTIAFIRQSKEIFVSSNQIIDKLEVYNLLGKRILNQEAINSKTLRLPIHFTNENYGVVRVYTQQGATNKKLILK